MISKIFGKKPKNEENDEYRELKERISQMNLSEMTLYVKGKIEGLEVNEEGLIQVLLRLLSKISQDRYYLDASDDDSKLKKAFELVLLVAKSKKITVKAVELIAKFIQTYEPLIRQYDKKYKEIYADRLKKSIDQAMVIIEAKVHLENKMNVLD